MAEHRRTSSNSYTVMDGTINGSSIDVYTTEKEKGKLLEPDHSDHSKDNGWLLLGCFIGIFLSYFIYGLLQETM